MPSRLRLIGARFLALLLAATLAAQEVQPSVLKSLFKIQVEALTPAGELARVMT